MSEFSNPERTAYVNRVIAEMSAIDGAYSTLRFLGYTPKQDTWKGYCKALGNKLADELRMIPSDNGSTLLV
jgi:hypothetical protein